MRGRALFAAAALVVAACSASSPSGPVGPCAQRKGTYRTTYAKRGGTCPNFVEEIDTLDQQPTAITAPCSGSISYSADNCRVTFDSTCPDPNLGAGYTQQMKGTADWDENGTRGTATVQITTWRPDQTAVCLGTYDMAIVRQ